MGLEGKERDRHQALNRYDVLDAPIAPELHALVDITATACDVPFAAINLISSVSQHQITATGFEPSISAREDSMCAAVLPEPDPVVVPDARLDPRFRDNPFVTGVIGDVRFYASAPLVTPDGHHIGRLCVFDSKPQQLSERQRHALALLAERVVDVLELRLRSRMLESSLDQLKVLGDELNRSNEHLSAFAAQVSHDLRNPLAGIIAGAEVLAQEPAFTTDPELVRIAENLVTSARRMESMVEHVLRHALVGERLHHEDVDLAQVLDGVVADLQVPLRRTGARIERDPLPVVRGDEAQLYAVLLNLVGNALKFRRVDVAPLVMVRSERHDDRWRVLVEDNGPGIPEDRRGEVFELYSRGDRSVAGSGIGLATAWRVVETHGGTMGIDESRHGGACVWFELPA